MPDAGDTRALGGYRLLSQLAVGGMAEIYIAKTAGVGGFEKTVALKVIHPNFSEDPEFVQMLVDEAKLAVQLQHANIVQTFDLGKIDNQYYIAMELIDGVDLYKLLRQASEKEIDFPFEVAAFIALEACNGLDYAHRKRDSKGRALQIVHRDISPQNILVSFDGEVKIVDFGIAKAALRGRQTAAGVIKGKYYYMSPEQAWGDPIDARTDVFSTGILLYEMLVGQMLYLEEDLETLLDKVRKANIAPPSTMRSTLSPELEAIVMKALKKRPQDRYQSAQELAQALTEYMRSTAPDFNRARLASFVDDVRGEDPTTQNRDPRASTALTREMLAQDENSLLFKLSDLKPPVPAPVKPALAPPKPAAAPRRARDQATSPVSLPEARRVLAGDFEESDQTIVDSGGETLMAHLDHPDPESTRPMAGPDALRNFGGKLHDLTPAPAALRDDPAFDDEDEPTTTGGASGFPSPRAQAGDDPPLPGVRAQLQNPVAARQPVRPAPKLASLGSRGNEEEERTAQHKRPGARPARPAAPLLPPMPSADSMFPTLEMKKRTSSPGDDDSESGPTPITNALPPTPMTSFDEPTRIPPAIPAPLPSDSQRRIDWPFQPISPNEDATITPATFPATPYLHHPPSDNSATALVPKRGRTLLIIGVAAGALVLSAIGIGMIAGSGSAARATIQVVSVPAGAEVRLDAAAIGKVTPLEIPDVDAQSSHHVRVSMRGFDVWESDVKFEPGAFKVRLQAVLVPTVGRVAITSVPPGAEAIVNGRIRGLTPATVGDLPPNEDVSIELRLRGYRVAKKQLSWGGKRAIEVTIPLEKAK